MLSLFNYKMLVGATVSGRQENVQKVTENEFANEHDFPRSPVFQLPTQLGNLQPAFTGRVQTYLVLPGEKGEKSGQRIRFPRLGCGFKRSPPASSSLTKHGLSTFSFFPIKLSI